MEHDEHLTSDIPVDDAPAVDADGIALPERRCILTGVHGPRSVLIRLAVGPDEQVAADLSTKLPGRGAWIVADRALLEAAMASGKGGGKFKGALARAFKSNSLKVPDNLPDQIAAGLERRALDRLGLENKSGNLIWGHERVGEAILKGKVRLLLHAADAKADGMGKLESRRRGASPGTVSIVLPVGRDRLSMALGRENVVHAAISDAASAARVIEALERWAAFNGIKVDRADDEDEQTEAASTDSESNTTGSALAEAGPKRH
ncbi:hypothetical protein GCM10011529_25750 [Polymorphobacter glacialis]|uniref:YlxR domain-containing protein n=1 Tax=Sandarakinorhabdus glacialis TaxID=1614636 RepID=A0A916ZXK1_9SPHN|nr:DUF448 domain-containing protein [Polymorphobacter glacialis]GGE18079.1 hypothetical protein GCM10011529_25750 [Polymorphobacter glacialis]